MVAPDGWLNVEREGRKGTPWVGGGESGSRGWVQGCQGAAMEAERILNTTTEEISASVYLLGVIES